ncbi:hypothetical protein L1987_31857 [Smallanthus sonchifolius]|uniref:Uncharacterized protein n=1 Tax=Smallanthus sonchifolius TaxID=185202 RepID=A0ACB9I9F7_9ASTR|nr:hypothetical protein L1987_31857 [Smallanthus sonchifolius]
MDPVVYGALEEICSQGVNGLTLRALWSKIHSHISSNGLDLCTDVKKALWSNLLNIPSLRFECKGVPYDVGNPTIQSFEDSEAMDLKIVAAEHLINSFVGIYDIKASDAAVSQTQRRVLERLAIARTDGITQNELAKEFGIKNNNMYYILRNLETRGLIVRQSTIVRTKEAGNDEYKSGSIVNTNMLHLYRYAKHLGHLQRLEITKEDKAFTNNENADREVASGDGVEERINDYVPAFRAICDRLEKADGKVLVVSDIKKELGYRKTHGHRAWRNILHKLKDAGLVEEFFATVNNKEVSCLRLLKNFSPETFMPKSHGGGDDDLDTEQQVKLAKRGQITDQLFELPIEQQIYDMIDAEGSKGLTLNEVYKRLGINNKRYYPRILDMVSRFQMHLDSESLNRGVVYRVWTPGNYNAGVPNTPPGKSKYTKVEKPPTNAQAGQLMLTHVDAEASEEQSINPISSVNDSWLESNDLQSEANDRVPDAELQTVTVKPSANSVSLEISSSISPAPRRRRSYTTYPCIGLNSVNSLREQRILEKLQEEKVLIKPELHRLLESIENLEKKQNTTMDRKTLERSLNKLQGEGHCKCISFAVPSVTNIGRNRTIDVILHPSVYEAEDLSDRVHDRLRLFEKQIRSQCFSKHKLRKCNKAIPTLDDVERINTSVRLDGQSETYEAMKNNGFVLAKMVRAKLLHVFLWGYLTGLPGWDEAIKDGHEQKNPHSSCKLFELDAAIKAMPLELFLQVAGSNIEVESMVEKCRNGLCLSDLPVHEYRRLMDTRATGRLSYLIDILRRLKLIRLIGGDIPVGPHTILRHSLEFKPYIEEPVGMVLPYTGVNSFDLRPHVRHDFVLASKISVDEYWNTLEYCYAASDPKAALHAFPGSTVHEVFLSRSWASVRVMTAHQRAELFKLVANEDIDKKITYKKCEKIAEKLNLTLEQVLRVFYDKRQKKKLKSAASAKEHGFLALTHDSSSKRKKSSKRKLPINNENSLDEKSGKLKQAKRASDATKEQGLQRLINEIDEANMLISENNGQRDVVDDDLALNQDENDHSNSAIHDCALSKLQSSHQKRFAWTENKDRILVIEYVKHRVVLGAKFHRINWSSLPSLPGPPDTCRRRMAILNRNKQFRKALMRLCNMLSVRYAVHLDASKNKSLGDDCRVFIKDHDLIDHTNDLNSEERWDDFDNKDIQMVLDEVLKYKQVAKLEATKSAQYKSKYGQSDLGGEPHELDENNIGSSSTPTNELKDGGKRQASTRRSRRRLPESYIMLMNKVNDVGTQPYKSLAVSNAIELFKLIFLSTAKAPEVPKFLAETLRRYSEHDLFTAFNYLRDKSIMVRGNDIGHFVLSQQFLHNISSSPFPVNTGKRVVQMSRWLHERENDLLDNGVDLSADLQCGDVLQLCVLMCTGEISMFPCLPQEGIGEIEDLKKRKCDGNEISSVEITKKPKLLDNELFTRKEKGFPGIQLSVSRGLISRVDEITLSGPNLEYSSLSSGPMEGVSKLNDASESVWEAMTCYARRLLSSAPELSPNLFKSVYSAIQKSGDQGLNMEGISHIIDVQGEKMPELIVEVLEAFGRAIKVNAFDSVHVVDSLYRSKYLLTSMASHQHDLLIKVPESFFDNEGEPLKLQQENHEDKHKDVMEETSTDLAEVHTSTKEVQHRVTILNHPEEVPQPMSEPQKNSELETSMSPRKGPHEEKCEFRMDDSCGSYKPILPWVNGDGTINSIVYKGLVRRVLGIVMQNPGILEEHVLRQMNVLSPQSCRKLLELMILDSHIMVRKMYQSVSNEPPAMLQRLLGCSSKKPKMICREHLFANPRSIDCL